MMMMAAAPGAVAAPVEEEAPTEFNVIIDDISPEKINVIKAVRQLTNLGLKEAGRDRQADRPGSRQQGKGRRGQAGYRGRRREGCHQAGVSRTSPLCAFQNRMRGVMPASISLTTPRLFLPSWTRHCRETRHLASANLVSRCRDEACQTGRSPPTHHVIVGRSRG